MIIIEKLYIYCFKHISSSYGNTRAKYFTDFFFYRCFGNMIKIDRQTGGDMKRRTKRI